jgi:uncharacterized repeat protein (TIGR01451 family)
MMRKLVIVFAALLALGGSAGSAALASPAQQMPIADFDAGAGQFAGFSTGTLVHADALQAGGMRLADVEVAFSGASYASKELANGLVNEMQRVVAPVLGANSGFGRGSGFELGLGIPASGPNQLVLADLAEAASPPTTGLVTKEIGPITVPDILKATLLRGQARSRSASSGCTIGSDLAHGLGYVLDLDILNLGDNFAKSLVSTSAGNPERVLGQSNSRTRLFPKGADGGKMRFGMMSETRQTILPVTFFSGTDNQFTVEVLGEWVLRAMADGTKGSMFYGPADQSPETPILRIINKDGKVTNIVTFQDLLGDDGFTLKVGNLAEIAIGEDPRAIGGDADSKATETGTRVLGGVDVVRVKLLYNDDNSNHVADVRIGHMEAGVAVPEGGVACDGIGMSKSADRPTVKPGDTFEWTVGVSNPNDCLLRDVKVVDTITTTSGVKYEVVSSDPKADSNENGIMTWNDIGDLGPGQSKNLKIKVKVADDSKAGRFTDTAVASGTCGGEDVNGKVTAEGQVAFENKVALDAPEVTPPLLPISVPPTEVKGATQGATPVGGVQTGAGGTSHHSTSGLPIGALSSLALIGLVASRRLRRIG